ncbi:hypothetical protein B9Z55_029068 [Caenorhabditis nigoni]|uniref:Glutamate synthase alpha subunit C-terminal domain-containing protein n=1 Tax=Caenorhabditis nigoni TaxID=1611254 RepID=A0A2G5S8Z7_9PELO|nr:hypothetical protein B9Z55_029068 [Caenorhabditis nigoni]
MLVPRRCPCTIRCQQCWSKCVVDAVGDQVCEYKTGGKIIMLGTTGRNFAAALNGEIACFCAQENNFYSLINAATVDLNDATTLIYNLKCAYPIARVSVKLVSKAGV